MGSKEHRIMSQFELEMKLRCQGKRLGSLTFFVEQRYMRVQRVTITIDHTCTATKNVLVYNKERGNCSVPVNGDVLMCHVNTYWPLSNRHQHDLQKTYLTERWHHGSQCLPVLLGPDVLASMCSLLVVSHPWIDRQCTLLVVL